MENNFIEMPTSAGHAVAYTIFPIFKHIKYCPLKRLWLVSVTLIFDGTPQIMVAQCQIVASRWLNVISLAVDNAILKNRTQNVECNFGCATLSVVLLKPNVANILLFNFCQQKFVQHGPITSPLTVTAFPCSFSKKMPQLYLWTKIRIKQWLGLGALAFQYMRASFLCPKCDNFSYLDTRQNQNMHFFPKSASSVSRSYAYLAKRIHNHIRSAER